MLPIHAEQTQERLTTLLPIRSFPSLKEIIGTAGTIQFLILSRREKMKKEIASIAEKSKSPELSWFST